MKQFRLGKTSIMCFLSYLESECNEKEKTIKRALLEIWEEEGLRLEG